MNPNKFFNAHHAPMGAFATLTLGCKGAQGGIAAELGGPACENLYIGLANPDRPGTFSALPFFGGAKEQSAVEDFDVEGLSDFQHPQAIFAFPDDAISRDLGACIDTWTAPDLVVRIYSPVRPIPNPETASKDELRLALVPAVIVEMEIDNTDGTAPRDAFFGYSGSDRTRTMRTFWKDSTFGIGQGQRTAIATKEAAAYCGAAFQPEAILNPRHPENVDFTLGSTGLVVVSVPPGEKKTLRFAVAWFNQGDATTGLKTQYYYQTLFDSIEDVLDFALEQSDMLIQGCGEFDDRLSTGLSPIRATMLAQTIRSYYGSTQLLVTQDGQPLWVVNEGEYRMMNTFDLTVDQLFFELAMNPWTVKNVLDQFVDRYSYQDEVRFPGDATLRPGGLTFTHDMGVANHFSPEGRSCYEQAGLKGVFSYMSAEELVNWTLCACVYVSHTGDQTWLLRHAATFAAVAESISNRDHFEPSQRNGLISGDSSQCKGGAEITTYDSLDTSLGQARNNLYLAVKTWAAYCLLQRHFDHLGDSANAQLCGTQADLAAKTLVEARGEDGFLPAVLGEGVEARIIPAIEGLIFPYVAGRTDLLEANGKYGALISVLRHHFEKCLDSGVCRFADGGWKLSSTSKNSWLSKIYLCQAVAEQVLGYDPDCSADSAHWNWLMDEDNVIFAWSDQMLAGKAHGSRYYPRGVTAALWLASGDDPIGEMQRTLGGQS
ncbi:MAG: beta-xylosidase [Armatimonadetes bacterium]|nr:beta-xylosidase [Armatimonadota bacterium]